LADFTTQRLLAKMDVDISRLNALTATRPRGVMIPMAFDTDREAVDTALATAGVMDPREARVVWIRNTLEIAEMEVSEAFIPEMERRANLEVLTEPGEMRFDKEGDLVHL
jgi:hypothetical protein